MDIREIKRGIYDAYARRWCEENGYSEPQRADGDWWAIPPGGYMPVPVGLMVRLFVLEKLG